MVKETSPDGRREVFNAEYFSGRPESLRRAFQDVGISDELRSKIINLVEKARAEGRQMSLRGPAAVDQLVNMGLKSMIEQIAFSILFSAAERIDQGVESGDLPAAAAHQTLSEFGFTVGKIPPTEISRHDPVFSRFRDRRL